MRLAQVCLGCWNGFSLARLSADDISAKPASNLLLFFTSLNLLSGVHNRATLDITMSFGFSVSDFLAAIQLANKIQKEFADAPSQFKAISDEYVV
jgi:hypothetical protein